MNSLITPLVRGPFWNISKFFQKFWRILPSSSQEKNQWKLTLELRIWFSDDNILPWQFSHTPLCEISPLGVTYPEKLTPGKQIIYASSRRLVDASARRRVGASTCQVGFKGVGLTAGRRVSDYRGVKINLCKPKL